MATPIAIAAINASSSTVGYFPSDADSVQIRNDPKANARPSGRGLRPKRHALRASRKKMTTATVNKIDLNEKTISGLLCCDLHKNSGNLARLPSRTNGSTRRQVSGCLSKAQGVCCAPALPLHIRQIGTRVEPSTESVPAS
jgi:hypothetical protein